MKYHDSRVQIIAIAAGAGAGAGAGALEEEGRRRGSVAFLFRNPHFILPLFCLLCWFVLCIFRFPTSCSSCPPASFLQFCFPVFSLHDYELFLHLMSSCQKAQGSHSQCTALFCLVLMAATMIDVHPHIPIITRQCCIYYLNIVQYLGSPVGHMFIADKNMERPFTATHSSCLFIWEGFSYKSQFMSVDLWWGCN
ncbi:hypothetical protein O6H91_15G003900 [Diphasiastrum complanatum]|uniref:Uncharacterized protein n=1 Tax=Diphasiastrum complanatum TaxID=34168 RepID=A0ACC2BFD0_DIPCM|nr:hypothetical protein O6H91_15G003900 [Diphasiastrum complanatum]